MTIRNPTSGRRANRALLSKNNNKKKDSGRLTWHSTDDSVRDEQAAQEEAIYTKETEYLENSPSGNIITGFDNYTKGASNAASQRRKAGLTDANRVFSRSSISYNPAAAVRKLQV